MTRPSYFPPLPSGLDPAVEAAIRACQGDWWGWGGSMCRRPELCLRACYLVGAVACWEQRQPTIVWSPGFDQEPHVLHPALEAWIDAA